MPSGYSRWQRRNQVYQERQGWEKEGVGKLEVWDKACAGASGSSKCFVLFWIIWGGFFGGQGNFTGCILLFSNVLKEYANQQHLFFFCRWLHGEVKLGHFIAMTKKLFWVLSSAMNMFLVIQKENKDQQTTAGEIGTNGYVHDFVRVRGSKRWSPGSCLLLWS